MKVYLAADMEGISGVCHPEELRPGGDDFAAACGWYTTDVNAAVEGAVAAGAEEVWVADGHGWMRNIRIDGLHPAARLVRGPARTVNRPMLQTEGIEREPFEALLLVGFHSRAGTPGGLLSHTWVGRLVHEIRLQGMPAGEMLLDAAIAGHYGIPAVLATGADDACAEAEADLPGIHTVCVKTALGPTACASLTPAEGARRIREGAEKAVRDRASIKPWTTEGPVTIDVHFHHRAMAQRALETKDGVLGNDDRHVRYEALDVPSTVRMVWRGLENALREDAAFLQ